MKTNGRFDNVIIYQQETYLSIIGDPIDKSDKRNIS